MFATRVGFYREDAAPILASKWLAVGGFGTGTILYSTDLNTWTNKRTQSGETYTSATYANGMWIVVGYTSSNTPIIYTSSDANTWTLRSNPSGTWTNTRLFGLVANGNDISLLAKNTSSLNVMPWYSTDGINWSSTGSSFGYENTNSILVPKQKYFDNLYVAAFSYSNGGSSSPANYTSASLSGSRTQNNISTVTGPFATSITKVNNSLYVATTGNPGRIYYSTNFTSWTLSGMTASGSISDSDSDGTNIVAVAAFGELFTSTDGSNWTSRSSGASNTITTVKWDGTQFVAVGVSGYIATSTTGASWSTKTSGTSAVLYSLAFS